MPQAQEAGHHERRDDSDYFGGVVLLESEGGLVVPLEVPLESAGGVLEGLL